jgi:recombination protein RecT
MAKQVNDQDKALALQTNYRTIAGYLSQTNVQGQIGRALPRHMNADRMVRVALISIAKTPKLLQCTPESLAAALTKCSSYGLEPNGRDIHLVPFWNNRKGIMEVQVLPDYKGLIQLMYRSGLVTNVQAAAVHAKDDFDYRLGSGAFLRYKPADEEDRGPLTHAWALAALKGGGEPFVVLNRSQIAKHMKSSQTASYDDSPWKVHPDAMWAKTAVHELSKFVPLSSEIASAFVFGEEESTAIDGEAILTGIIEEGGAEAAEPPKSKSERLNSTIEGQAEPSKTETKKASNKQEAEGRTEATKEKSEPQGQQAETGGSALLADFRSMFSSCRVSRDWEKLRDHFTGPDSEFAATDEERAEINRICNEEVIKLQSKKKSGEQQRPLV